MNNRKGLLLAIAVIVIGLFITAGSYAFWSWASNNNKSVSFNTSKALKNYIIYEEGNSNFSGDFKAGSTYTDGMSSSMTISKTAEAANIDMVAIIHMDINQIGNNMKNSQALKWVVTQGNQILAQGNFVGTNNGDTLDLVNNIEVTTTPTTYTIWIWLDRNMNPSDALTGETLDTNVWTEITQAEGVEDRFEIISIGANYQNISATVVDSKYKVTHYAVVPTGDTPSSWTSVGTASNIYNLNTTVNSAGTYDVYFKDQNNRQTHKSVTVSGVDTTAPSCTFGSFSPSQIANSETATIELTCTDNESQLTVSNLTVSDITKSNNNITVTNITKSSVSNGYKYTITVTGTDNDGSTTLTLPANKVRNSVALGNAAVSSTSITIVNEYTISFSTGNNNCALNPTTYATKTPTYGDIVNIPNPSCTGYTFAGWTANSGLDTTNAKYGDTNNPTTTWSSASSPVTATYFKDLANHTTKAVTLTATWTANTYTVRFINPNNIPNEYQAVEYIASDGTQYIDSLYHPGPNTGVEVIYQFTSTTPAAGSYSNVFGVYENVGMTYGLYIGNSTKLTYAFVDDGNDWTTTTLTADTSKHTYKFNIESGYWKYDNGSNTAIADKTRTKISNGSMYIFATRGYGGTVTNHPGGLKIWSFKIYENGLLTRNYVPVYRKSDDEVGLYETVMGVFYANAGTGNFVKGVDNNAVESKTQSFTYGTSQALDANTFTKDGYTFAGWNTQANGSGTPYTNGQQVNNLTSTNNATIDLYAQWQRNSYTVQVVVNNGTGSATKNVLYNNTETFAINNSPGYGNPTVSCTNNQIATISGTTLTIGTITNDTVCTVGYTPNSYTVRFNYLGYQPVEYIEGTGTQYIDTGYKPNPNTGVEVTYQFTDLTQQQRVYGVQGDDSNSVSFSYSFYINGSNKWAYAFKNGTGNWVSTNISVNKNKHTFRFNVDSGYWKLDSGSNTAISSSTRNRTSNVNLHIFAVKGASGGIANIAKLKIYDFKIYENGVEIIHLIPVYRISDGEIGLFDVDNEVFYPNAGSDTFKKGADLHTQSFTYGTSQALDENTYTRSGYSFNGWSTNPDGTGTSYSDEQIVGNLTTEDEGYVDLYTKWLSEDYTINYTSGNELCPLNASIYTSSTHDYEDVINVANPACSGFTFSGWSSSTITSGAKSGTTNDPTTPWGGSATTNTYFKNLNGNASGTTILIANWTKSDNAAPALTVGTSVSGTTYAKTMTATITLSDNVMLRAGTYTIKYGWSTSALTCADMTDTTTISVISGDTFKTAQVTIDSYTGAGRLYVCNPDIIYDRVGNQLAANTVVNTQMYLDNTPPTGTMTLETNGGVKTTLTLTDANSGMSETYYYKIDTSPITCNDTTTGFSEQNASTYTFMVPSTGTYYVCAKASDKAGNASYFTDSILVKAYLKTLSGDNDAFKDALYKTNITDIYFVDNVSIPNDAVATYDLDDTNVGLIKGWIVDNLDETGKYKLYIGSIEPIYGRNLYRLFKDMTGVKSVTFDNFDTSEVTTINETFRGCSSLISLDLSDWNTSNITDMYSTFYDCSSLNSLNLDNWNTSKVQYMGWMFQNCSSLTSLDLSSFNTSNVTTMQNMFRGCSKLISLDLSNFNTSKVTNMSYMFDAEGSTSSLSSVNLSGWNTSNVTNMARMFDRCDKLTTIDLSSFDTAKVTNMEWMFRYCSNLLAIYVSSTGWNTNKVSKHSSMFYAASSIVGGNGTLFNSSYLDKTRAVIDAPGTAGYLTELPTGNTLEHGTSGGNTAKFLSTNIVKNKIKKITFTNSISGHTANGTDTWDVSLKKNGSVLAWVGTADANGRYEMTIGQNGGVVPSNGYYLFSNLNNLVSFDGLEYFDTSNVTNMRYMFSGCSSLESIDLSHFDTSSAVTITRMFQGCTSLTTLDLTNFDTSNVKHMANMFNGDTGLTSIDLSSFDTSHVTTMEGMFYGCTGLSTIDLSNFNTSSVTNMATMFSGCTNLLTIYASANIWDISNVTTHTEMFNNASSLVGGNGTVYSSTYIDKTRALVDGPNSIGYLTEKPTGNMLEHGTRKDATTAFLSTDILKNQIKKITFTNSISGHTPNDTDTWDVSFEKNGTVLAWVGSPDGNGMYEMTIGQNGGVIPVNGFYLLSYLTNLSSIDGMQYLDTSDLINMRYMFTGDSSLTTLDLSHFDTSSAITITGLFSNCSGLTTLDLTNFNTSNVKHMANLFNNCTSLTSVNLSSFNTSNVTTMSGLFQNSSSLTSVNISNFNTSNVTNMSYMFAGSGITTLNLTNFNTSNVTNMGYMFYNSSNLTSVNLSSFNTSNVTNMSNMFNGCSKLTTLDLSNFNTSKVTTMYYMFANCTKLVSLDVSSFDTSNVETINRMFENCQSIETLDLSSFYTPKATSMNYMFYRCYKLRYLNISNFDTSNVTNMNSMFYDCHALTYLNLSSFDTAKVSTMQDLFRHCNQLLSIYVTPGKWTISGITKDSYGRDVFYYSGGGCITNITGGNGKMKNNSHISYLYAVIDSDDTPGYLTAAPTVNVLEPGSVGGNTTKFLSTNILKNQIKKITFTNSISGHTPNGTDTWDVSFQKNGSVLAWVGSPDGNGRYEMTIGQTGGVKALNGFGLFSYLNNLVTIDGMEYFDVSDVTLMRSMFNGCTSLTSLDLSSWDTSKVKLMNYMFQNCSSLTTIYASDLWDTTNVTNSTSMFTGASNLPNFNSSVVDATNAHTGTGGYLTYKVYP